MQKHAYPMQPSMVLFKTLRTHNSEQKRSVAYPKTNILDIILKINY